MGSEWEGETAEGDGAWHRAFEHSRRAVDESSAFVREAKGAAREARERLDLEGKMERHPYATLAFVAGIGYLLGGGLFTRLTGHAVRLGARAVLLPMIKAQLLGRTDRSDTNTEEGQ